MKYLLTRITHESLRDSKNQGAFIVVGRQVPIESKFATVICAPVYTTRAGLATQVNVGINEGLKHDSAIQCDELISLPKAVLTEHVGTTSASRADELNEAMRMALEPET